MTSREFEIRQEAMVAYAAGIFDGEKTKPQVLLGGGGVTAAVYSSRTFEPSTIDGMVRVKEEEVIPLNENGWDMNDVIQYEGDTLNRLQKHKAKIISSKVELISKRRAKRKIAKMSKRKNRG